MSIFKSLSKTAVTAGLICTAAAFLAGAREIVDMWDCSPSENPRAVIGTLYDDSTFVVSGRGNMMEFYTSADVPWDRSKSRIKEVIIEDGVTSIGSSAFGYSANLTAVTISGKVTEMGNSAFNGCEKLTSVTISEGVKTIGENAFRGSAIESINIPSSVTSIESFAFTYCPNLKSVTIGRGLAAIGEAVFWDCTELTTITIQTQVPPTVSVGGHEIGLGIPSSANFYVLEKSIEAYRTAPEWSSYSNYLPIVYQTWDCGANVQCALEGGIFIVSGTGAMTDYIPSSGIVLARTTNVSAVIAPWENYKSYINSVIIENGVTSIGNAAFEGSDNLTSVKIGSGVTSIGAFAFQNCTGLDSIQMFSAAPPAIQASTFTGVDMSATLLLVPQASVETYSEDAVWSEFQEIESYAPASINKGVTVNRNRANSLAPVVSVRGKTLNVRMPSSSKQSSSQLQIRVIDMRGKTILSRTVSGGALSLSKVPAGRYVVDVRRSGVRLGSTAVMVR